MAKPLFQDIVPPERRSIKKVPIPERKRVHHSPDTEKPEKQEREKAQTPHLRVKRRRKSPLVLGVFIVAVLGIGAFSLLSNVTGASILLTLKGQTVVVNTQFGATTDENGELPYQVATYQKDGKLAIPATGEEYAETKATGVIRIFNNFSSQSQKLVANTRFETPKGKIFRISQSVIIPGKSGDTPGSVDVTVTADAPGPDYNVGLSDFTIPGFKGDPKYTKVYALSKTAIDGGFIGKRKKVDEAQIKQAREEIRRELQANLIRLMQKDVPDSYIFLPNAYFIEFTSLANASQGSSVVLTEHAVFRGLMFKRHNIARAISQKSKGSSDERTDIYGTSNLVFNAINPSAKPWESNPLAFTLKGTTTLISSLSVDKIKEELAGKPRKSLNAVLAGYPSIAEAQVIIRPFWKRVFPGSVSNISVEIAPTPVSP